jgi:hypothetical protein
MKNLKLFEDFVDAKIKKPGFFGKMISGAKHAMGMEKKEDREALDAIYRAIADDSKYGWISNVREIKPGIIVATINSKSVTVDQTVPEILYKGIPLDLHNIEEEVESLYRILKREI